MLKLQIFRLLILLAASCGISAGALTAPKEPSNLTVKALGVNSFQLNWKDNSDNEAGFQVYLAVRGTKPGLYKTVTLANATSDVLVIGNELRNFQMDFQIRAYSEDSNRKRKYSKLTSISSATTLPTSTFGAPTKLVAKTIDDGTVKLTWKDNSTSETAYAMEYKEKAAKKWAFFTAVNPGIKMTLQPAGVLQPGTEYSFRVRAVKSNAGGTTVTKYSNIVSAKTKPFLAPTQFSVTAESDGEFSFKWKDNSSLGTYELQQKKGDGDFTTVSSTISGNASSVNGPFEFNTNYQFRLRGVRSVDNAPVYTAFSSTVSIKATSLARPENLTAAAVDEYSVKLNWKDISDRENAYKVQYRKVGDTDFTSLSASGNATTHTVAGLEPGTLYDFRVIAISNGFFGNEIAASSPATLQGRSKDGIGGDLDPPVFFGTSFTYDVGVTRLSELDTLTVTGLPPWLTYTDSTRKIAGIPTEEGVRTITLKAKFKDNRTVTKSLVLRIIRPEAPPVIAATFNPVTVAAATDSVVSLDGKFSDPDTRSAARFTTAKGTFDIILYSLATPETIENFLDYMDAGRYDDMFFHRSVDTVAAGLVIIQGGGYTYTSEDGFKAVPKFMQEEDTSKQRVVPNEPGISNLRGTVAMAKLGSDPNSASSEFFVNANDVNAGNLDKQNGGFTVFGRVPDSGMEVIDDILDLPTKAYSLPGLGSGAFGNVPMNAAEAPAAMEPDKLVLITAAGPAPILSYEVTSQNTGVATASLNGNNITIHGVTPGSTTVQVQAKDLDGNTVSQNITVTVP